MLAYRLTIVIYLLLSGLTYFFTDDLKIALLLGLFFVLLIVLSVGSTKIQLGFYKKAFCKKQTHQKVIALTFDDGPDKNTSEILKLLNKYNAKATFFCIGSKVAPHALNLKQMVNAGHEIGNHSFKHRSFFPIISTKKMVDELEETSQRIEEITGQTVKYFRPPFGVTNPRIVRALNKTGLKLVGWSIRSFDTMSIAKEKVIRRVLRRVAPGKIILLHDTSSNILEVLDYLLDYLTKQDYRFVTVSELDQLN